MHDIIDHLNHPIALMISALLDRNQRLSAKKIIIDDDENILQAIFAGIRINMLVTTHAENLSADLRMHLPSSVIIKGLSKRTGKKLFGGEKISRNFAIADLPEPISLESFTPKKDLVVLDHLTISGNIGAIIRTSVALNASSIVLLGSDHIDIYDRRVIRASRGFVFKIPIISTSATDLIHFCKKNTIKILVTTPYTEITIQEVVSTSEKLAIVFGGEKEGCSQELFNSADIKAKIPLNPEVESLNVSVAAGIILHLRNQTTTS